MKSKLLVLASALSLCAAYVHADDSHTGKSGSPSAAAGESSMAGGISNDFAERFRALDKNGDGFLSKQEAAADRVTASDFDRHDRNHDGKLDPAEFQSLKADKSKDRSLGSK